MLEHFITKARNILSIDSTPENKAILAGLLERVGEFWEARKLFLSAYTDIQLSASLRTELFNKKMAYLDAFTRVDREVRKEFNRIVRASCPPATTNSLFPGKRNTILHGVDLIFEAPKQASWDCFSVIKGHRPRGFRFPGYASFQDTKWELEEAGFTVIYRKRFRQNEQDSLLRWSPEEYRTPDLFRGSFTIE